MKTRENKTSEQLNEEVLAVGREVAKARHELLGPKDNNLARDFLERNQNMSKPTFIGIDIETTSKDTKVHEHENVILEIAVVVLGEELDELERWTSTIEPTVFGHSLSNVRRMCSDFVFNMHLNTGLIDENGVVQDNPISLTEAEITITRIVNKHFIEASASMVNRPTLLGHSIQFERRFLQAHMPHLAAHLHYRQVDARSVEILAPELEWGKASTKHRALSDILHSIEVLRLGRERLQAGASRTHARKAMGTWDEDEVTREIEGSGDLVSVPNVTEMILQRVDDLLGLVEWEQADLVNSIKLLVERGDFAAAQGTAEHAKPGMLPRQAELVFYLQGLRDANVYPLARAVDLLRRKNTIVDERAASTKNTTPPQRVIHLDKPQPQERALDPKKTMSRERVNLEKKTMKLERVTLRIPIFVPSRLIDILIIPLGAVCLTMMFIHDVVARDKDGRLNW